jgi:hypothetical protein
LREVRQALAGAERRFASAFPDFQCGFPIYVMDTLGRLDGAGRQVAGRPALVLGIDQIAQERDVLPLPVFLAHELFHRYHSQISGFSDDPGERQAIWRALWAEGLATYVSYRLTPGATVDEALIAPRDLAARAQPQIRAISADLLAHLDQTDHATYQTYFTYGDPRVAARGLRRGARSRDPAGLAASREPSAGVIPRRRPPNTGPPGEGRGPDVRSAGARVAACRRAVGVDADPESGNERRTD